ncbi:MAG: terminase large subunit [Candidatus Parvarchaeum sp.]
MANQPSYEAILRSPTLFALHILKFVPLRYQAEFIEDDSKRILVVSGRQAGKSTMIAVKALWTAFVKPQQNILIVAPTLRQSRIVYEKVVDFINVSPALKSHIIKLNMEDIRFDNASYIHCLTASNTGENIRGFSATMLIFDEAGSIRNDEIFSAVEPSLAARGEQFILSGTPRGKRGYFYNSYANNSRTKQWNIYRFKSRENPIITEEFLREEKMHMTENMYRQEYEAEFIDDMGLFYSLELVSSCLEDYDYSLVRKKDCKYYMGADISRAGEDETGIVILEVPENTNEKIRVIYAESMKYNDLTITSNEILRLAQVMNVDELLIDSIGVGGGVYDMVSKKFSNTSESKLEGENRTKAYTNLKILLEKKEIILREADERMIHQFGSYSAVESATGNLRIVKSEEIHDDIVDALVIALSGIESIFKYTLLQEGIDLFPPDMKQRIIGEALNSVNRQMLGPTYTPIDINVK